MFRTCQTFIRADKMACDEILKGCDRDSKRCPKHSCRLPKSAPDLSCSLGEKQVKTACSAERGNLSRLCGPGPAPAPVTRLVSSPHPVSFVCPGTPSVFPQGEEEEEEVWLFPRQASIPVRHRKSRGGK